MDASGAAADSVSSSSTTMTIDSSPSTIESAEQSPCSLFVTHRRRHLSNDDVRTEAMSVQRTQGSRIRWLALAHMCVVALGSAYCFDSPAALQEVMLRDLHISSSIFTLFYSVYSWPNVVLCLFGGMFIDKLGRRIAAFVFCSLVLIGQMLFATGAYVQNIWLMLAGRVVFGLGAESQGTTMNTYLTHFFLNRELNLAFGVQMLFGRAGSSTNMYATRPLHEQVTRWFPHVTSGAQSLGITLYMIGGLCVLSLLAAVMLTVVDAKSTTTTSPESRELTGGTRQTSLAEMLSLPLELWLLALVCVFYYISVFPFISVGVKFFRNRFKTSNQMASALDSLLMVFSAVLAPFLGTLIDRVGRNLYFIIAAAVGTLVAHCLLAFSFVNPIITMVLFSVCYSLMTAFLWPLIVNIVNERQTGTAFGMTLSIQNTGLALTNMLSGYMLDNHGYFALQIIMIMNLLFCIAFGLALFHVDESKGVYLNLSSSKRRQVHRQRLNPDTFLQ